MSADNQDPSLHPGSMGLDKYSGIFTMSSAHDLAREAREFAEGPIEEYFAVLSGAASAQGYPDMATAIDQVSKTSMGTLLHGNYEAIVTATVDGKPTKTKPAEQYAREEVASNLGFVLADLYGLRHGQSTGTGTSTIADIRLNNDYDKELFVIFARILAREPERLDATAPAPDKVTDVDLLNITPEERTKGVVTLEGQPDKIVLFQKVTVDSTVPGFDFELWRHNYRGFIRGDATDRQKIYLERKQSAQQGFAA